MEFKLINIKKGPNKNQMFEACKNIGKCQTEVFTIEIDGTGHLLPCFIHGIVASDEKDESWNLVLIVRKPSLIRHSLLTEASKDSYEVKVDAVYSTKTLVGEIKFPIDTKTMLD